MIQVQRTTTETLDTPEAIGAHIHAEFERRIAAAPFKAGDRVRIIRRDGIPDEFLVGDCGTVLLCDPDFSALTTLLGLNRAGLIIQFPVQTANLEKLGEN